MSNFRNDGVERFAELFRALANPSRLRIFLRLATCCEPGVRCGGEERLRACVGEVGRDLGIAPSTVSHHIKELRRAGLIRMERRGQNVECWVDPDTLRDLRGFLSETLSEGPDGRDEPS